MWMDACEIERENAEPALTGLDQAQTGDARQSVDAVPGQRLLMLENIVAPEFFDEIDRGAEPDRAGDVGGAGFEAVRRVLELALLKRDIEDHLAAALPGRHR